jgi:ParB-like chromosome segregation protein Spo0J
MLTDFQANLFSGYGNAAAGQTDAQRAAGRLFEHAYGRGVRSRLLAKLTGRPNELRILSRRPEAARRTLGIVVVSLSKIVGSENRGDDFDAGFNPLKRQDKGRWTSVAAAGWTGVALPAVELVQAADGYYVRDGHHRISVAKALGQLEIEARVVN